MKALQSPVKNPATCSEAARRLREEAYQASTPFSQRSQLVEAAFILDAFGSIPVPQPILDRWEWSKIG